MQTPWKKSGAINSALLHTGTIDCRRPGLVGDLDRRFKALMSIRATFSGDGLGTRTGPSVSYDDGCISLYSGNCGTSPQMYPASLPPRSLIRAGAMRFTSFRCRISKAAAHSEFC